MAYILLLVVLVIIWIILKNKIIIQNIKSFLKRYKALMGIELLILIILMICLVFNNTLKIVEKDPHSNKVLKSTNLKVGEQYIYKTMITDVSDETNIMSNYKQIDNIINIQKVDITKVTVSIDGIEKEYKYGTGFSYYNITSCNCGTPIVFERPLANIIKILAFGIVIIDALIIILIKDKKEPING